MASGRRPDRRSALDARWTGPGAPPSHVLAPIGAVARADDGAGWLCRRRTGLPEAQPFAADEMGQRHRLQAVQAAGDRTEFGSRNIKLIRAGKTTPLDFRKAEHKNFPLEPNDSIIIEQRGVLESDRG